MAKVLMKGNDAIAEAAIRAGCRFFSGYPITPQSEIVEYMSWRMPEVGGKFVQTESELAGISMLYGAACCGARTLTSSSGPGFSLMQEGISYLSSAEVPTVIVDVMRYGNGLGDITPGQSDYLQAVKNGGHGDYRCIVLAPSSIQNAVDLMGRAYDLAEKYRNPVLMLFDGATAEMVESIDFPEMKDHGIDTYDWALRGDTKGADKKYMTSKIYYDYIGKDYDEHVQERFGALTAESDWEEYQTEDADVILVSYGIISRVCKEAVIEGRKQGKKIGIIRPITLYPFPKEAFKKVSPKAFVTVEMCALPQMAEDVALAARNVAPTYAMNTGAFVPKDNEIYRFINDVLDGNKEEV